jgi:hypothetical protein
VECGGGDGMETTAAAETGDIVGDAARIDMQAFLQ